MIKITRQQIESGEYEAEDGVIVMVAPEGVSTVRYLQSVVANMERKRKLPQGVKRMPYDGIVNSITDTRHIKPV